MAHSAGRVKTTDEGIGSLIASLEPTDRVVMEVSSAAWEVARRIEPHVQKVVVVSPDDTGIAHARTKIAGYKVPRDIDITVGLPKTSTGKIQKFVLRKKERTEDAHSVKG